MKEKQEPLSPPDQVLTSEYSPPLNQFIKEVFKCSTLVLGALTIGFWA